MSERRMSRDSTFDLDGDPGPLYRRPDDAGSRLSQNLSMRRGSAVAGRPHMAPPIFSSGVADRSARFARTYPYPHPNAPEPTAGFPYAFPDPQMGPDGMETSPIPNPALAQVMSDATPYSRSPELRVSHKLAERKRRKEMKDLFDDLRMKLPLDRTLKTSKWEILSKAVEHVSYLEEQLDHARRENEELRRQAQHSAHSHAHSNSMMQG